MMTILAKDYIESGFSAEDAALLTPSIDSAVKETDAKFEIDFKGVQFFTTLFFSNALTRLIGELGKDEYKRRLHVVNLTESGQETYEHALDYAIEFYGKTPEERKKSGEIAELILEDL